MVLSVVGFSASAVLHAQTPAIRGVVFSDANGNGSREVNETGIAGVVVSNQIDVAVTDAAGRFELASAPTGIVFVSVPDGRAAVGPFWRSVTGGDTLAFALRPVAKPSTFRFIHASDSHIAPDNVPRFQRFRALVDSVRPDVVLIAGDLIRDAMSATQATSESLFELFRKESGLITTPVRTVPGNHDHYGIIPSRSRADPANPLYNRGMYRKYLGPDYYSFTLGGVHFVGLNSIQRDDSAYYGHIDSLQLAWLERDLQHIPATMPVVTFTHMPFVSAFGDLGVYFDGPSIVGLLVHINGQTAFRHTVGNVLDMLALLKNRPVLALGAHTHAGEKLAFQTPYPQARFEQSAAIVGGGQLGSLVVRSGFTVYRVVNGVIDAGTFVGLDPPS